MIHLPPSQRSCVCWFKPKAEPYSQKQNSLHYHANKRQKRETEGWPYLLLRFQVPKLLEEGGLRRELKWFQEVKQAEEFLNRVLKWCSSQQHFVFLKDIAYHRQYNLYYLYYFLYSS